MTFSLQFSDLPVGCKARVLDALLTSGVDYDEDKMWPNHMEAAGLPVARLVCREWRTLIDGSVQRLKVDLFQADTPHLSVFSRLIELDLESAASRNAIDVSRFCQLPHATEKLQALTINEWKWPRNSGTAIMRAIGQLTALTHLYMERVSRMRDRHLLHLRPLTCLRNLSLQGCKRITDEGIANLAPLSKRLQLVGLHWVPLITGAHLNALTAVTSLGCCYCPRIQSDITNATVDRLYGLKELAVQHTGGALPPSWICMTQLTFLFLTAPKGLRFDVAALRVLSNLTHCGFAECPDLRADRLGLAVEAWTALQALDLRQCHGLCVRSAADGGSSGEKQNPQALVTLVWHMRSLRHLTKLYLYDCGVAVTDRACKHIASRLPRLSHLTVRGSKELTEAGIAALSSMTRLTEFDLGYPAAPLVTEAAVQALGQLPSLRCLHLAVGLAPEVASAAVAVLTNLSGLTSLNLRNCKLHYADFASITRLQNLVSLTLDENADLDYWFVDRLASHMPNLRTIQAVACGMEFPKWCGRNPKWHPNLLIKLEEPESDNESSHLDWDDYCDSLEDWGEDLFHDSLEPDEEWPWEEWEGLEENM